MNPRPKAAPRNPNAFARSAGLGHIGDVRARDRDVSTGQAVDHARRKQHRQALRDREHGEADDGADEAENQDGAPAESIGERTENRCGNELRKRERGKQKTDDDR